MDGNDAVVLCALEQATQAVVDEFQKYPLDFLSERDIQARFFIELRNRLPELRHSYSLEKVHRSFNFTKPFQVHAVTTEYFLYKEGQSRFDIAILSNPDREADIWRQRCRVGIEIKLWQPGYGYPNYRSDIDKLQNYQLDLRDRFKEDKRAFTGIAMLFVHPNITEESVQKMVTSFQRSLSPSYPEDGIALHVITGREDGKHHYGYPIQPL